MYINSSSRRITITFTKFTSQTRTIASYLMLFGADLSFVGKQAAPSTGIFFKMVQIYCDDTHHRFPTGLTIFMSQHLKFPVQNAIIICYFNRLRREVFVCQQTITPVRFQKDTQARKCSIFFRRT